MTMSAPTPPHRGSLFASSVLFAAALLLRAMPDGSAGAEGSGGAPAQGTPRGPSSAAWIYLPQTMKDVHLDELPLPATAPAATATRTPTATPTITPHGPSPTPDEPTPTELPTEVPTDLPTEVPTETPTETPEPKPTMSARCSDWVTNGDFEQGATDWELATNAGAQYRRLGRVIRQPATNELVQPFEGRWLAALGGGTGGWQDALIHPDESKRGWLLPAAGEIVSATLRFQFAIASQETPNRRPDDVFTVALYNDDKTARLEVLPSELSEETVTAGEWRAYVVDVTQAMTQRPRWDRARLELRSDNNQQLATWHHVDDLSLTVCLQPEGSASSR